jgi:hypothetical protein
VVYLVEVVIFGGEPEYSNMRRAVRSTLAGAGDGGGGFEGREKRTAEEANLLACNYNAGAGAHGIERWSGGRRWILRSQEVDHLRPVSRNRRTGEPCGVGRQGCIKRPGPRLTCAEVEEEPVQARHNGDGETVCVRQVGHIPAVFVAESEQDRRKDRCGIKLRLPAHCRRPIARPEADRSAGGPFQVWLC